MPEYRVTETAGPYIAGRRSPGAGETVFLSEREAAHDLRLGSIEKVAPPETAATTGGKKKGGQTAK